MLRSVRRWSVDHQPADRQRDSELGRHDAGGLSGSQNVIDALAVAAGELAKAALEGDLSTVLPEVVASPQSNTDIRDVVDSTVTDALAILLGRFGPVDPGGYGVGSGSRTVRIPRFRPALSDEAASLVSGLLGGDRCDQVGPQVGAALVALPPTRRSAVAW